jgi:hypothetical protein
MLGFDTNKSMPIALLFRDGEGVNKRSNALRLTVVARS